jgi:hypothetical protein
MPKPHHDLSLARLSLQAERFKEDLVRRLLTKRHSSRGPHPLSAAFDPRATAARRRFRAMNLVGVGFGAKETAGGLAGTLALRVYVTKKAPKGRLPRRHQVPSTIDGMLTDVIPVGRLRHHDHPISLEASISRLDGDPGTLGCVVFLAGDGGSYLLSAAHVLAPDGESKVGDVIVTAAQSRGGSQPIATLADFEPLRFDGTGNQMDAAIARLVRKTDVVLNIPMIGLLQPEPMGPILYQSVRKFGATSGHTLGIVTDVSADVELRPIGQDPMLYRSAIHVAGCERPFSQGGDSGSVVVDALSNRPVGILFGGDGGYRTFVTPMERILSRFHAVIAP